MSALPLVLFWGLAAWGLVRGPRVLLYIFFASMPFGSVAVVPPALVAGLTLTPTPIVALLIILRTLGTQRGLDFMLAALLLPQRLLPLFLFWIVAVITTLFMPRLFAGQVEIIPMRGTYYQAERLYPTTQNISQLAYVTISVFTVVAFARLLQNPSMRQPAIRALCLGAAATVATGLLDIAGQYLPLDAVLDAFRTASYALAVEAQVLGQKRIVGLMPEASTYGSLCLSFLTALYFFRRALPTGRLRDRYTPALLLALAALAWLSTSSAAYVGLALFGLVAVTDWCWAVMRHSAGVVRRRDVAAGFWFAAAAFITLSLMILLAPSLLEPLVRMIDRMVFQKTSTHSFEERTMWTAVSWQATLGTFGLGVGLGGTRASSFIVSLISNVGFAGAAFYLSFLWQTLQRRALPGDIEGQAIASAVRWAFLPIFVPTLLIGTTADFGALNAFLYGAATSVGLLAHSAAVNGMSAVPRYRAGLDIPAPRPKRPTGAMRGMVP